MPTDGFTRSVEAVDDDLRKQQRILANALERNSLPIAERAQKRIDELLDERLEQQAATV